MYLNHPCRLLRLCSLLVLCTLALGGCEMTRESNRIHQARRAANAERAAAEAEAKARLASGDVPAYWTWRNARTYYEHKHAIGEITVNGRSVLVTRFLKTNLWTGDNGDELLDKYASLRANEGFLHSDLELGRDGHSAEEDAERFRRPRSSRQCYDTREIPGALSVAFIDADGVIVNIEELPPNYIVPHCSQRPVHQTLVMRSGWFAANGIQPGDTVTPFTSILVRELPGVLARHEHESAPAPVAWAHWNGWPLAQLTLSAPQNGNTARRERDLIITMPVQESIKGEQEMLARDDGYEAFHDAKLDREEALLAKLRERRQAPLRPWEGVLYPIHQQMYHDLVQSLDPERRISMPAAMQMLAQEILSPGSHQQALSVVLLDDSFTVTGFADWEPKSSQKTPLTIKSQDAFALVTAATGWREYGLKVGDTLPLNTPLTEQAAAQVLARAQARHNRR